MLNSCAGGGAGEGLLNKGSKLIVQGYTMVSPISNLVNALCTDTIALYSRFIHWGFCPGNIKSHIKAGHRFATVHTHGVFIVLPIQRCRKEYTDYKTVCTGQGYNCEITHLIIYLVI